MRLFSVLFGIWLVLSPSMVSSQEQNQFVDGGNAYVGFFKIFQNCRDGNAIIKTKDGEFVLVGGHSSSVYLAKTNMRGDVVWEKDLEVDNCRSVDRTRVLQTKDGGFVVSGHVSSWGDREECLLFRTDSDGNLLWAKRLGRERKLYGNDIVETTDGKLLMTGRTSPYGKYMGHLEDIWVVQFNPSGEIMWDKKYGEEEGGNRGYCIREATDKGFVVGGTKNSKCFLMKIDDSGKLLWERTFPVGEYGQGDIYSIVKASDGGYILAGKDYSMHGDFLIIKTDVNGELEWKKSVGGDEQEIAYQVGRTRHGAYIVVGRTRSFGNGWEDIFLVKISESGNILSQTSIGSKDYEIGKSIYCLEDVEDEQTSAELFVILGVRITSSERYTFMLKTSDQGTLTSFSPLIRMMNPPNQ